MQQISIGSANGWKMPPQMTIGLEVHIDRQLLDTTPAFDMVIDINGMEMFRQEFDKCIPLTGDIPFIMANLAAEQSSDMQKVEADREAILAHMQKVEANLGAILAHGATVECEFLSGDEDLKEDPTLMFYFYPEKEHLAFAAVKSSDSLLAHMVERHNQ